MTIKKRNISDIGQLNKRVEFQSLSGVSDGAGGLDDSWSTFMEVWASVNDSGGVIYGDINAHTQSSYDLQFVVRYNTAIYKKPVNEIRLVFRERPYRIRNVKNLNQANYYLEITCDGNEWQGT